jgi:hypothetical protein
MLKIGVNSELLLWFTAVNVTEPKARARWRATVLMCISLISDMQLRERSDQGFPRMSVPEARVG